MYMNISMLLSINAVNAAFVQTIATNLRYPVGMVKHLAFDENADSIVSIADLVIYSSFVEGQSFPNILLKAMCYEKPIIAPDLPVFRKYVCICI